MSIKYKPEIDGLRGISVFLVIFYHAQISIYNFNIFNGGFLGVDIFFVISGYLITSLIWKEIEVGKFSFLNFYERRIRRIIPLLFFVIVITLPFAFNHLNSARMIDFGKSIISTMIFSSNMFFWYTDVDYGGDSSLLKPLLHTWSIAIEEQFYILFPIFFLTIFIYFPKLFVSILIFLFLFSLSISEFFSKTYHEFNYFFLLSRGWELLAGTILVVIEKKIKTENLINNLFFLPTVGFFLILYSLINFNDTSYHPSSSTLLCVLGVCLIIFFSNKKDLIIFILSRKVLVWTGLISYSLYLWHYPIFAFARLKSVNEPSQFDKFEWIFVTIIISILSYFIIEKLFRNKKIKFRYVFIFILICTIFSSTFVYFSIKTKGYDNRFPEIIKKNLSTTEIWNLLKNKDGENCYSNKNGCEFVVGDKKNVLLIGDSHAASVMYDLKKKLVKNNFNFLSYTMPACIYFPEFNKLNKQNKINDNCNDGYFKKIKNKIKQTKNLIIIFIARYPLLFENSYFDNKEGGIEDKSLPNFKFAATGNYNHIEESFIKEISDLSKNGNDIILVYTIPEVGWDVPEIIRKKLKHLPKNDLLKLRKFLNENIVTTSYDVFLERNKKTYEILNAIKGKKIYRIYPEKLFCNKIKENRCMTHDLEDVFYSDTDHLSTKGSKMLNNVLLNKIIDLE